MTEAELQKLPRNKASAKRKGEIRYFTGNPCTNAHEDYRLASTGQCNSCRREEKSAERAKRKPGPTPEEKEEKRLASRERERTRAREKYVASLVNKVHVPRKKRAVKPKTEASEQARKARRIIVLAAWKEKTKESQKVKLRAYIAKNLEKILNTRRAYALKNRDKISEYKKAYVLANHQRLLQHRRAYEVTPGVLRRRISERCGVPYDQITEDIVKHEQDRIINVARVAKAQKKEMSK